MHVVQNDRLPLRVVVQVLFFEQLRQSTAAGAVPYQSLVPHAVSYGSSRSSMTRTNTASEWDGVPTAGDLGSLKSLKLVGRKGTGSEKSSGSGDTAKNGEDKGRAKAKAVPMPNRMLSNFWSGKAQGGENSSSDTSESRGSMNPEEVKSHRGA